MPQPQSDYFAQALSQRIIHETERAQRAILRFIQDGRYQLAAECSESWKEDVMRACHDMNAASADTIRRLQQEIGRMYGMIPMAPFVTQAAPYNAAEHKTPEPVPSVEELYRELKGDDLPKEVRDLIAKEPPCGDVALHPVGCTCIMCDPPF